MIGVLVVTHGNLGNELIKVAELIKGPQQGILSISVDASRGLDDLRKEITASIRKVDSGSGVLVLTDLFGGTPSNVSLAFLKEGKVEVVTGVNLPMLLKVPDVREKENDLAKFAAEIRDYGKKNIYLASEVLKKKIGDD
ncbi:MAG TPA: PTS sugar transporter subunit IIA [Syntrophales bacterium]|nr:PTS sugar transporter subunit IIA [Syntrophobacterales bacterium]HNS53746.1 PTS sugar transporter subunit IIA [Syntrophales bacterium]HQL89755.1 PTS sugar transporter subunit IIA [Syntrophales bacterium]